MKNTNFFKNYSKPLALLAILIILSIVLFSSVNEYSIENLTPKPDIEVEIFVWIGPYGSIENDLVNRWLDFTNEYGDTPNVTLGKGKASEFTRYLELDKYPELNLDTNKSLEVLKSVDLKKNNNLFPFVSVFFVGTKEGKAYKSPLGLVTGKEVSYDNMSKTINSITSSFMFSDALYESDLNKVLSPVTTSAPAALTKSAVIPDSIGSIASVGSITSIGSIASSIKTPWGG